MLYACPVISSVYVPGVPPNAAVMSKVWMS